MADEEFLAPDLERRKILAVLEREILSLDGRSRNLSYIKKKIERKRSGIPGRKQSILAKLLWDWK